MSLYTQYVAQYSKEEADKLVQDNPCTFCYLQNNQLATKINGFGSDHPTFMVVSDFIHKNWLSAGVPFSGPMVRPFTELLNGVGIDINEVYWTSLVKCPPCKNLKKGKETAPKKEAVTYCSAYLDTEIKLKQPKVIIACGQTALDFFFPKFKMTEKRCQVLWSDKYKCNIVPIYNPESMSVTYEFDDIIRKAFEQAYNAAYHPEKLKFPEVKYLLVKDIGMLRQVAERIKQVDRIAYDLETNSITYSKAKILSVGVSWAKNTGVAWPLWIKDEEACNKLIESAPKKEQVKLRTQLDHSPVLKKFWSDSDWDEAVRLTKEIFENTECKKGGHNTFFDNLVLHYNGIEVKNYTYDTMIMKHLLDEEREKSLDYCSWIYTDKGGYKMAKEQYLKSSESNYANIPLDVLLNYNAGDASVTYELYDVFRPQIIAQGLKYEMANIRIPLQKALMEACIYGMRVDRKYLRDTAKKLDEEIKAIEEEILPYLQKYYGPNVRIVSGKEDGKPSGFEFNINSSDCLKDLLFDKMKLKVTGTTESGAPSTNESALLKLSRKGNKIADLILQRKKKFKFKTTYIDGMEDLLDENDRIHPSFNVCGTESGRLSSSSPNVQQIPRDKTIKRIFSAPDGYEIGECDFSQAELRVMAALSNDITMKRIYEQDRDLHMELAVTAFHKPASEIDKEQRTVAKTCFDENAMILTPKGYIRAKDLANNKVLTLDGKEQNQQHIFEKQPGYEIELSNGSIIKTTTNHKFMMFNKLTPYWKEANQLKVGDTLGNIKWSAFGDYHTFRVGDNLKTSQYKLSFTLDEDLAYVLGLYLSDGSISHHKVTHSSTLSLLVKPENKELVLRSLKPFAPKERPIKQREYSSVDSECYNVYVCTRSFVDWVENYFGRGKDKHIADIIYTSPKSVVLAFLSGLLDTDSYITKRVRFINTRERLARDVAKLGTLLGYEMSFKSNPYKTRIKGKQYTGLLYSVTFITKPEVNLLVKKDKFNERVSTVYDKTGWVIDREEFGNCKWFGKKNYNIANYLTGKSRMLTVKSANELGIMQSNYNPVKIISIKPCEVNACVMETDTHYFVGEGFESHNCNFLIGYAGGPDTLKANLTDAGIEITKTEAERIIKTWHDKFKFASSFLTSCNRRFQQDGFLVTPFGRRRRMCRTFEDDYLNQKKGREGQNFIIQGLAAELAFISLINIARDVKQYGGHVISTVHDSILIEYPVEQRDNIARICKKYTWVTYPFLNGLYMKSDFACAQSWGDKKEYDVETGKFVED